VSVQIEIVAMDHDHIDEVIDIDVEVYPKAWSRRLWHRELADPTRTHLVASDAGVIIGHGGIMHVLDEVHLTTVAVAPDRQGSGLATRLILALLDSATAAGSTAITLEVRAANRRAQRLYSRFGFVPSGVRRGYYSDPADDAIIFWLNDLDGVEIAQRLDRVRAELRSEVVS